MLLLRTMLVLLLVAPLVPYCSRYYDLHHSYIVSYSKEYLEFFYTFLRFIP